MYFPEHYRFFFPAPPLKSEQLPNNYSSIKHPKPFYFHVKLEFFLSLYHRLPCLGDADAAWEGEVRAFRCRADALAEDP